LVPHFDMTYLREVSKGSTLFMVEMIQIFLTKTPETLGLISDSIALGDWEQVGFFAHKLKATYAYVGMSELRNFVMEIEQMAKNQENLEQIAEKFEYLRKGTELALVELMQHKIELEQTM